MRRCAAFTALLVALLLAGGIAYAAATYPDRAGDVSGGGGPDIVSIRVSNTARLLTFSVRFAHAPPLRADERDRWVDMLLVGVDVPPLGKLPDVPGGEWRGADYALGLHGPSTTGQVVNLRERRAPRVATFRVVRTGTTLTFTFARRAIGGPAWFTFSVVAAREMDVEGGGVDFAPARGTFRYAMT